MDKIARHGQGSEDGWTPPRTPWGTPDLTGIWSSKNSTPLQRHDEYADREYLTDEEVAALDAERERAESGEVAAGRDVRAQPGTAADVEGAYNYVFSTDLLCRGRHGTGILELFW